MNRAPQPAPTYFGATDLFGWLHAPPEGRAAAFGLVICNPFGFEEVCAHRALRELAAASAVAGVPTLRFDYAGCGNSRGDAFEPSRLQAWLGSIHDAVTHLKAASGVPRVCLVGVRLGASLAALAAAQRDDVSGLIAIAPVVRGRDHVRELRVLALAGMAAGAEGGATPGIDTELLAPGAITELLEPAGFVLTPETVESLKAIDLRGLTGLPAGLNVLIVPRDDFPGSDGWAEALERLGARVQQESWPGYAAMMTNPQDALVPRTLIEGVVRTLADWQAGMRPRALHAGFTGTPSMRGNAGDPGSDICEASVEIDTGASTLFGVLTRPTTAQNHDHVTTGIVLLNSGSVHHIGPNRLWVELSRRWAARGCTVLRIDLSGIGDSPARPGEPDNVVYSAQAAHDIDAALAYLRDRLAITDCHLMGLCSGAFHAFKAAVAGQAITSAVMINPLTFSWEDATRLSQGLNEYEVLELTSSYRRRMLSREPWIRLFRGELHLDSIARVVGRRIAASLRHRLLSLKRVSGAPPRDGLGAELLATAHHGTQLRFVFARGDPGHALLLRHAGPAVAQLLSHRQASIDLVDGADHTFTRIEARARLVALLDAMLMPEAAPGTASIAGRLEAAAPAAQPHPGRLRPSSR